MRKMGIMIMMVIVSNKWSPSSARTCVCFLDQDRGGTVFVFDILYYYALELYHRCCSHMCLFVTQLNTIDDYDNQDEEEEEEDNEGYDLVII